MAFGFFLDGLFFRRLRGEGASSCGWAFFKTLLAFSVREKNRLSSRCTACDFS